TTERPTTKSTKGTKETTARLVFGRTVVLSAIVVVGGMASQFAGAQQTQNFDNVEIHIQPAQGQVYMLVGADGNVTVQVGKEGVLVVDTQYAPLSNKILAAIRTLSNGPIRYIINTHVHPDHVGGNENIRKAGSTIAGGNVSFDIQDAAQGAQIIAHDNVL